MIEASALLDSQLSWRWTNCYSVTLQLPAHFLSTLTLLTLTSCLVCLIKVDQRSGSLFWVSCDQNSIGTTTADNLHPQQLYRTTKEIQNLYLDWLRGGILWLEGEQVLIMSMMGGKPKELLHLAGGVRGNIAFDLRANSLLWNSKGAGLLPR